MARAKRSELIRLISDLCRAVVIEASGGEGEQTSWEVVQIIRRARRTLKAERKATEA